MDPEIQDDKKVSSSAKDAEDVETTWIMCNDNNNTATTTATIGYDCHSRPYMTVFLIISILVFIILRKSSFIKNWVASRQEKLQAQADEEEGLMQRVFWVFLITENAHTLVCALGKQRNKNVLH